MNNFEVKNEGQSPDTKQSIIRKGYKYQATIIGIVFALGSILTTLSMYLGTALLILGILIPPLSIFPVLIIEEFLMEKMSNYSVYAITTIITIILAVLLLLSLLIFLRSIRKKIEQKIKTSKRRIIFFFVAILFIIQPLGLYIGFVLGVYQNAHSVFYKPHLNVVMYTFAISGLAFIPIGLLIDVVKNNYIKKNS